MDIVIDLDDTLVKNADPPNYTYNIEQDFYNLVHASREFLCALVAIPNARIHFFSSGWESRNKALVRQIMEDCSLQCSYNVFSAHQMKPIYRKGLQNLGFEMQQTIMVDNESCDVAAVGEESNFLQVFYFKTSCDPHDSRVLTLRSENSLIRALGLITWAMELSTTRDCTLVQALVAIQWDENGKYAHQRTNSKRVYELGLAAMQKMNPQLELWSDENSDEIYPWSELEAQESDDDFDTIGFTKRRIDKIMKHRLPMVV